MAHSLVTATRIDGAPAPAQCAVADEQPVGLVYNGIPHAVLMATPQDLEDLALGFTLTDGIALPSDVTAVAVHPSPSRLDAAGNDGVAVAVTLTAAALQHFLATRRQRAQRSFTSCGLCGIEAADQIATTPALPPDSDLFSIAAIRRALAAMPARQILNAATGALHAAAWADLDGSILLAREDVGRHNALDKLIGARARLGTAEAGFCLITSRCSYEMVQKAAAAGMPMLVAISAPTARAIDHARRAGLILIAFARADAQTVYVGTVTPDGHIRSQLQQ